MVLKGSGTGEYRCQMMRMRYQVSFMYVNGYGGQKNLKEELKWLRRSAA